MNFIEEKILEKNNLDKLRLRFPPENNGVLHLGHAKSICLNFGLAEKYERPCNLRFDDTNPVNESNEFTESIIDDINWLGFKPSEILYTSNYFDIIKNCALELIRDGRAYVDYSTSETIAEEKGTPTKSGVDSYYRNSRIEDNLRAFVGMIQGDITEGVVRAKIDMTSPNMLLRDPIIYRIITEPHHRTGSTWKVYPMYDFAHPISDLYEGITDSLCTLEFEVHRPLYNWVIDKCKDMFDYSVTPEQTEFNRLNVSNNILSKRHIKALIENNLVSAWDDPRLLTIKGLRRRGYTPTSIINFCEKAGWTKRDTLTDYKLLEACLREELNKTAHRYMCVIDPIKLTITNYESGVKSEWVVIENNPEDENAGKRNVAFSGDLYIEREDFMKEADNKYFRLKLGSEVRLKGAYVVKAYDCIEDEDGNVIEVLCTYDPNTKSGMPMDRKVKGTIHWVSVDAVVDAEIRDYGLLFNDDKPTVESPINEDSLVVRKAYVELDCLSLYGLPPSPIQFMRKGYYIMDEDSNDDRLVFNRTVSLKEGW